MFTTQRQPARRVRGWRQAIAAQRLRDLHANDTAAAAAEGYVQRVTSDERYQQLRAAADELATTTDRLAFWLRARRELATEAGDD